MTFRVKTRFRDFLKVMALRMIDNSYARAFILLLFLFSIRIDTTLGNASQGVSIEIWSLSVVLFFGATLVLFIGAMRQLFLSSPKFRESVEYAFTNQGVFIRGTSFEQILDWKAVSEISETANYFLIEEENMDFFIIEKDQIKEQTESVRSALIQGDLSTLLQGAY